MSLIINHNISAMNTQRNLEKTNSMMSKSLQKLSSGYRINVAADDPSGLIISEQLRSQTHGLQRAISNSQEASNVIGIAEGALIEMNEILRTMRALALHSANSGITAPDQIRADQSEVDSGIQTIERISATTKYSDQYLLNGSKGIVYTRETLVDDTMDHELLDISSSRLDQIFKREGITMSIMYNGITSSSQASYDREARRAYLEAEDNMSLSDITDDRITEDQQFILTGTKGSRTFSFGSETSLGSIASAIDNVSDSTGVGAKLIFSSDVTPAEMISDFNQVRTTGDVEIYGADINTLNAGAGNSKVVDVQLSTGTSADIGERLFAGLNLDGHGRMYAKVTRVDDTAGSESASVEIYKDKACTMLVGSYAQDGDAGAIASQSFTAANNSGLLDDDILLDIDTDNALVNDVYTLSFAGMEINNTGDDWIDDSDLGFTGGLSLDDGATVFSGVDLGVNTDETGNLYFKLSGAANDRTVEIFNNSRMAQKDLVATGIADLTAAGTSVRVEEVAMEDGSMSGLNATLTFDTGYAGTPGDEIGSLQFESQGLRVFATDYGSQEYLRFRNIEGQLFGQYLSPDDASVEMIDEGITVQEVGNDATIAVNGTPLFTDGLSATMTTPDYSGELVFNEGDLGETRIAQVGYNVGGMFSRAGALQAVPDSTTGTPRMNDTFSYATNARHVTTEELGDFIGGMQYQLGETDGDQSRTIYGIPSMSMSDVGRINYEGDSYSLQDVLGGGDASLAKDPVLAMRIISRAVDDVASLRARLGAFQKNMLQTNINSLSVAVENITKTESAIRDANMAAESTDFTKNQILVQAGTAMLAQANTVSQNVLQLLG